MNGEYRIQSYLYLGHMCWNFQKGCVGDNKERREFRIQFGAIAYDHLLKTVKAFYKQKIQWEQTQDFKPTKCQLL